MTKCARRSLVLITPPRNWCSPDSQCADVSKLMYHMRINDDLLDHDLLATFDGQLRASVSASLCGDFPDHSWWQATTGVTCGGLGLRTAFPASPVACITCRSLVSTMVDHFGAAIGAPSQPIMALSRLVSTLLSAVAQNLVAQLNEAMAERELLWRNVLSGGRGRRDLPTSSLRHARGITPDDGDGDDEHPLACKRLKFQALITAGVDTGSQNGSLQMHESEGSWKAHTRLAELGAAEVDHTCLWRLNPHHGPVLDSEPVLCAACQAGSLDTGAARAPCCALGEATRGHNAVTALIHAAAQFCDHTAETEVTGLNLRQADVLTSALGNAHTALEISFCSPARTASWPRLRPIPSSPGHIDRFAAPSKSIARKRNFVSAEVVLQRLHSSVTLEIWKRSARQVRSCWPLAALPAPLHPDLRSLPGACWVPSLSCCSGSWSAFLPWCAFVSARIGLPVCRSRSEQVRQLAIQPTSLASLEDVVTLRLSGLCCWLEWLRAPPARARAPTLPTPRATAP